MLAAIGGHDETIRMLIKLGANARLRDTSGKTALMHASANNFLETTKMLYLI